MFSQCGSTRYQIQGDSECNGDISIVEAPSLRAPEYTGGRLEERPRKLFMSESLTPLGVRLNFEEASMPSKKALTLLIAVAVVFVFLTAAAPADAASK